MPVLLSVYTCINLCGATEVSPSPTLSGKLHIGHIFSYIQAEIIARFQRM
ncbi:class I tRNA ligase family protein [Clostridium guangxiense]